MNYILTKTVTKTNKTRLPECQGQAQASLHVPVTLS